jgi:two-component system heavy metal sensor histidine kinase CusS
MSPPAQGAADGGRRPLALATVILAWYCASAVILVGSAVAVLYWALIDRLRRDDQAYIVDKVQVLRQIASRSADANAALAQAIEQEPGARVESRLYLRLLGAGGERVMATPAMDTLGLADDFPAPAADPAARPAIAPRRAAASDGGRYRLAAAAIRAGGRALTLQLAYRNIQEDVLLREYRGWLIGVLAGTALLSLGLGLHLARRGLRPLAGFTAAVGAIGSDSLGARIRIEGLPLELRTLASSFNATLDRLEDSFGRLDRFSSDIAHELRTPVNTIMTCAEITLLRLRTPGEYQDALASNLEDAQRLARLIDRLLFLARADQPSAAVDLAPVLLGDELTVLARYYQDAAEEAGILLVTGAEPGLRVLADRDLLHRAIGNAVENGLAHTSRGGTVAIEAVAEAEQAVIRIRDNGSGIAPEHLAHVFERLWRADPARGSDRHAGLGLSIVATIARLHRGTVSIDTRPGSGTTVTLRLPRAPAPSSQAPAAQATSQS